jgi:hypothetical protein
LGEEKVYVVKGRWMKEERGIGEIWISGSSVVGALGRVGVGCWKDLGKEVGREDWFIVVDGCGGNNGVRVRYGSWWVYLDGREKWSNVFLSVYNLSFYQNQLIYCFSATRKKLFKDNVFSGEILICIFYFLMTFFRMFSFFNG